MKTFGCSDFSLIVENICFGYQPDRLVLRDLSLTLARGNKLGLSGANGSGKTTLFRCLTGLEKIRSGSISMCGNPVCKEKDFQQLRKKVAYCLQDAENQLLFPTVLEDLAFGPLNLGLSAKEAQVRAQETLQMCGLENFADRMIDELSGGEKKFVALAAMLAMRPKALLLDEPLNNLDNKARERLKEILASLDCAQIIVDHDAGFLKEICHSFAIFKNGRLEYVTS